MYHHLTVAELWRRIEARVESFGPNFVDRLGPGLGAEEIERFERELGVDLPEDYVASLRAHAGCLGTSRAGNPYGKMLFVDFILLPPPAVLWTHRWLSEGYVRPVGQFAEVAPEVQASVYHPGWIPVVALDDDLAAFECIDTVPTRHGAVGQVVWVCTKDDDRVVSAPGFRGLLSSLLSRLEKETPDPETLEDDGLIELR